MENLIQDLATALTINLSSIKSNEELEDLLK